MSAHGYQMRRGPYDLGCCRVCGFGVVETTVQNDKRAPGRDVVYVPALFRTRCALGHVLENVQVTFDACAPMAVWPSARDIADHQLRRDAFMAGARAERERQGIEDAWAQFEIAHGWKASMR